MEVSKLRVFCLLMALIPLTHWPSRADVPPPTRPPAPPAGYCSTIYGELEGDLQSFNALLTVPPTWKPVSGGPTVYAADLQQADGNSGPSLSGVNYLPGVLTQLQELRALGVQGVVVVVGFPVLYEPFYGSQANLQPYLNFYSQVAQAVKSAGLKLIVENDVLLTSDVEAGWTNLPAFYATLDWNQYMAARATMAATIAQTMQPDYLVLAEEPDTEASQTGQTNMKTPSDAAQMISGEIAAVQALNLPGMKLGAGIGSWLAPAGTSSLEAYITAYVALPLDYIDFHIYPINTVRQGSLIGNTLTIASMAAAAGKPVALSEAWTWKMENSEWGVITDDAVRGRYPFSFWAPLDVYFQRTLEALAEYTDMVYVAPDGPDYLFAYQTYGGTAANGGAANCTCTTTSCNNYDIVQTETTLASAANQAAAYSTAGLRYYRQMVPTPDITPPSTPSNLTGVPGYTTVNLSWTASTDNVGVAGYNVYRCSPPAEGQSCTAVWIANATSTTYSDAGLLEDTPYNYQIQAFDLTNNLSGFAQFNTQTYKSSPLAPAYLTATAVSATEVALSWTPPTKNSGLSEYRVYAGTSSTNLPQIGTTAATVTTYNARSLSPNTFYYFAAAAVESGVTSPMSPQAWTSTPPMPNPPTSVTATATGPTTIVLTWQENMVRLGLPVNNFQIFRGESSGSLNKIATVIGTTTYTDQSVKPDTTFYYEIVAVDTSHDASAPSSQVTATTQ